MIQPGDLVNILVLPDTGFCKKPDNGEVTIDSTKGGVITKPDPGQIPQITAADGSTAVCNPARYLYQAARVLLVDKTAVPQPVRSRPRAPMRRRRTARRRPRSTAG